MGRNALEASRRRCTSPLHDFDVELLAQRLGDLSRHLQRRRSAPGRGRPGPANRQEVVKTGYVLYVLGQVRIAKEAKNVRENQFVLACARYLAHEVDAQRKVVRVDEGHFAGRLLHLRPPIKVLQWPASQWTRFF